MTTDAAACLRAGDACLNGKFSNSVAGQKCDECEAGNYLVIVPGGNNRCAACPQVCQQDAPFATDASLFHPSDL